MANDLPYMPFFVSDYLSDDAVRCCSLAAQGLWTRLLCHMWRSKERGYLLAAGGLVPTLQDLERLTGYRVEEIAPLLEELEAKGVFSRDDRGVIYSRKISKESDKSAKRAEAGRAGGRRSVEKRSQNFASSFAQAKVQANNQANAGVEYGLRSSDPDQKESGATRAHTESLDPTFAPPVAATQEIEQLSLVAQEPPTPRYEQQILRVFDHYRASGHPRTHLKPKPESKEWRAIEARLHEGYTAEDICAAIDGMHATPWNRGENKTNTKYLDLELAVRDGKFARFLDAGRAPSVPATRPRQPAPTVPDFQLPDDEERRRIVGEFRLRPKEAGYVGSQRIADMVQEALMLPERGGEA